MFAVFFLVTMKEGPDVTINLRSMIMQSVGFLFTLFSPTLKL